MGSGQHGARMRAQLGWRVPLLPAKRGRGFDYAAIDLAWRDE
jgi:hypothetical protein